MLLVSVMRLATNVLSRWGEVIQIKQILELNQKIVLVTCIVGNAFRNVLSILPRKSAALNFCLGTIDDLTGAMRDFA